MSSRTILTLAVALQCIMACAPVDPGLGNAVRRNMAAQVVDPDPAYPDTPLAAGSGERAAIAMRRYRAGAVAQPMSGGAPAPFAGSGSGGGAGAGAAAGSGPR